MENNKLRDGSLNFILSPVVDYYASGAYIINIYTIRLSYISPHLNIIANSFMLVY